MVHLEPVLTTKDIAGRYAINRDTARRWLRDGVIGGKFKKGRWETTWDSVFAAEQRPVPLSGPDRETAKEPLVAADDFACEYKRHPDTIRRWLRDGTLVGLQVNDLWYFDAWKARRYLELEDDPTEMIPSQRVR